MMSEKKPVRIFFRKAELLLAGTGPDGSDDILREQLKKSGITEGLICVKMYIDPDEELCPTCKGTGVTGGNLSDFIGGDAKTDAVHTYSECQTCKGEKVVPKKKEIK